MLRYKLHWQVIWEVVSTIDLQVATEHMPPLYGSAKGEIQASMCEDPCRVKVEARVPLQPIPHHIV